jgi:hypothetical protein
MVKSAVGIDVDSDTTMVVGSWNDSAADLAVGSLDGLIIVTNDDMTSRHERVFAHDHRRPVVSITVTKQCPAYVGIAVIKSYYLPSPRH